MAEGASERVTASAEAIAASAPGATWGDALRLAALAEMLRIVTDVRHRPGRAG